MPVVEQPKLKLQLSPGLQKRKVPNRISSFVLVPGTPRFKSLHPGVDHSVDPKTAMPLDADHKEYLLIGEATAETLLKAGDSGSPLKTLCPRVLFFSSPDEGEDQGLAELYKPHSLKTYSDGILKEKQYPLDFHIAAHGNPNAIGSITLDFRMGIDDFADNFDSWLIFNLGKESVDALKGGARKMNFIFHRTYEKPLH